MKMEILMLGLMMWPVVIIALVVRIERMTKELIDLCFSCGETFREPLTGEWLEFHDIDDKRAVVIDAAIN